ncbi:hypothetical protein N7489_009671 [Penicillium chrysogenum]|uniref:uncharacterized protein n=1 Tax=Penicillium chrysogenum TaxID=5076 RepID=UPI0023834782|nr:uncharacterized protein N7489_009671 [Penicillium chrysogenum]KAJ5228963.1 hypothetical protein N7489_009671 [Penicillium chrysogenum]KAJ5258364.1 hypothetical protein N7524_009920 [Penicillium chrysogenum]
MNASRSTLQVDATMGYGNALAISPNYGTSKGNYIGAAIGGLSIEDQRGKDWGDYLCYILPLGMSKSSLLSYVSGYCSS